MNTKIMTTLSVLVVLIACVQKLQSMSQSPAVIHVQPVYEDGAIVACQHYYSVPLKAGGEFRYQWQPNLEAFRATNFAALR